MHLTTSDPETSVLDGGRLFAGQPEQQFRGVVIPGAPAEEATFRIDGVIVATSVPGFVFVNLQTNQGLVRAQIFTAGGVSYAIPRAGTLVSGVTGTVASSRVTVSGSLETAEFGLRPVGAQPRTGPMFRIAAFTGATSIVTSTVLDADAIRGNSDAIGEESPRFDPQTEVLATLTLKNRATVAVRGLRFAVLEPYGQVTTTWAFDRAALAAAGATIADVTNVVSFAVVPHDLTWEELGFDLI